MRNEESSANVVIATIQKVIPSIIGVIGFFILAGYVYKEEGSIEATLFVLFIGFSSLIIDIALVVNMLEEISKTLLEINKKLPNASPSMGPTDEQIANQQEKKEHAAPNVATISKNIASVKERVMSQWRCPVCGTLNSNDGNWCAQCGKKNDPEPIPPQKQIPKTESVVDEPVEWYCTECGTKNRSTAKFCNYCGKSRRQQ